MRLTNIIAALLLIFLLGIQAEAEDISKKRFQRVGDSIVVDSQTGLMWALQDNGADINWWDAKKFCKDFSVGGYTDWRLPDIKELATLYTKDNSNGEGFFIADPIKITDCCMWSTYDILGGAVANSFKSGKRIPVSFSEDYQLRALPVRGTSKIDLKKYKNF